MGDEGLEAMLPTSAQTNESTCLEFALFWASDVNFAVGLISEYPAGRGAALGNLTLGQQFYPLNLCHQIKPVSISVLKLGTALETRKNGPGKQTQCFIFILCRDFLRR